MCFSCIIVIIRIILWFGCSGFIFLRFLCLAILNPKSFNLVTEAPSQIAARTLKLVANCLIKLANLVEAKVNFFKKIINNMKDAMIW